MKTNQLAQWAMQQLATTEAGHDWSHIERVWQNAQLIHRHEGGSWRIVEAAVILHDVADPKFFDEEKMLAEIEIQLTDASFSTEDVEHVLFIISHMSFSKSLEGELFDSLEYRVVQDADRLDAMGAVGIARAFSYGGHKGRPFFDANIPPVDFKDATSYRNSNAPTINHFYEKLLLLKDLMKTPAGAKLAQQRHDYMLQFLQQFYDEIGVEGWK